MDTCIAIRTMTFKNGIAYLQAGGGIVFDSVEEDEFIETINKLMGNVRAIESAERKRFWPTSSLFADIDAFCLSETWYGIQQHQAKTKTRTTA